MCTITFSSWKIFCKTEIQIKTEYAFSFDFPICKLGIGASNHKDLPKGRTTVRLYDDDSYAAVRKVKLNILSATEILSWPNCFQGSY